MTNAITGIADSYYDSCAIVVLSGQVGSNNLASRSEVRQRAFQEVPAIELSKPITKASFGDYVGRNGDRLVQDFIDALSIAQSGRNGPVLIDMPMDIQRREVDPNGEYLDKHVRHDPHPSYESFVELSGLLTSAERPVFLIGAGCRASVEQLRSLVERLGISCVASLPAVGLVPTSSPFYFGMVGHTGMPCANWVVQHSDLVVALGARLDVRQTGTEVEAWAKDKKIVRVDIDQAELDQSRVRCDLAIHSTCEEVLAYLNEDLVGSDWYENWSTTCGEKFYDMQPPDSQFARVIGEIDEQYVGDTIFVSGVGSHQQHAARHLTLDYPKRQFVTSAGHGCMGAGLPMAIGIAIATGKKVVLIDGDGSFQLSLNELGTLAEYYPRCDLHIHILDNSNGGIVSQFARLNGYDPRETTWHNPDFEAIAKAYGLSLTVHKIEEEGVWPILEGGKTADDMTWPKTGGRA